MEEQIDRYDQLGKEIGRDIETLWARFNAAVKEAKEDELRNELQKLTATLGSRLSAIEARLQAMELKLGDDEG